MEERAGTSSRHTYLNHVRTVACLIVGLSIAGSPLGTRLGLPNCFGAVTESLHSTSLRHRCFWHHAHRSLEELMIRPHFRADVEYDVQAYVLLI